MTRPTKFSIWLTATVISAVGVGAAGVAVVVSMLSPLNFANLSDFEGGGYVAALVGYSDHTDTVCRGVWGCEQGYSSASAEFRKFDFVWNANAFAESHSNTYQRGVVVIEYTSSALSEHDRQGLQSIFDNVGNSDDPPQGPAPSTLTSNG